MNPSNHTITVLLRDWRGGRQEALDELMPLVYEELRRLARHYMRSERRDHTLRPTAVVHEAYLRLAAGDAPITDRAHFFAIASTVMRHILLDWARGSRRAKRGGGAVREELEANSAIVWEDPDTVIEVDRLLHRMLDFDARKAKIVEMLFFGGMTYDEIAEVLGISAVTVHRDLKMAKAWMATQLRPGVAVLPV